MMICRRREPTTQFCEFYASGKGQELATYLQTRLVTPVDFIELENGEEYIVIWWNGDGIRVKPDRWIVYQNMTFLTFSDDYFHLVYEIVDPE